MMPLCLTYDHRIIDGADGARFTDATGATILRPDSLVDGKLTHPSLALRGRAMPIAIACPHCDWNGRVKDELAGKTGKCPTCGELVPIPKASVKGSPPPIPGGRKTAPEDDVPEVVDDADIVEDAEVVDDEPRPRPKAKPTANNRHKKDDDRPRRRREKDDDDERPAKARRRPADDDDDERPAKARRRPADDDDDERPAKARRRPADDDERPAMARRRLTDDDDEKPRTHKRRKTRPKKQESRNTKRIGAVIGGLLAVVLGGAWLAWIFLGDGRFRPIGPIILTIVGLIAMAQGFTGIGLGDSDDEDDE